jgi:hypothetical protein
VLKSLMLIGLLHAGVAGAAAFEPEVAWDKYDKVKNTLPKDAAITLDRGVDCNHLAGEFGGDRSLRDKELTRAMNKRRCNQIEADVLKIRNKYKNDHLVQRAFKTNYLDE